MKLFPESIDFIIPGFKKDYVDGSVKTLSLKQLNSELWYDEFVDKVIHSCGRFFLPVCRMSDGEYLFILGEQKVDFRMSPLQKLKWRISNIKEMFIHGGGLGPRTIGQYHSGKYSAKEWNDAKVHIPKKILEISNKGIIAWHLNYTNVPFQERYFPALDKWLQNHNIPVNDSNYYPFYFVYALLTGPRRGELLKGRSVLVVNGAQGNDKRKIIAGLMREGVAKVLWCSISLKRSLYDSIDVTPFYGKVDLALVGAGIGKVSILLQMEGLKVPCIDAGYVFEVWKDPNNKWKRVICASDDDWHEREEME